MEFDIIDGKLHIKSDAFREPEVIAFIGDSFPYILADFFENENIHSMNDFILNWKDLKSKFESFFTMAMMVAIIA